MESYTSAIHSARRSTAYSSKQNSPVIQHVIPLACTCGGSDSLGGLHEQVMELERLLDDARLSNFEQERINREDQIEVEETQKLVLGYGEAVNEIRDMIESRVSKLKSEVDSFDRRQNAMVQMRTEADELELTLPGLRAEVAEWEANLQSLKDTEAINERVKAALQQLERLEAAIAKLVKENADLTVDPATATRDSKMANLSNKLAIENSRLSALRDTQERLEDEVGMLKQSNAESALSVIKVEMAVHGSQDLRQDLTLEQLEQLVVSSSRQSTDAEELNRLTAEFSAAETRLASLQRVIASRR